MNNLLTCILLLISGSLIAQVEVEFDQVIPLPDNINSIYEESVPIYDPANHRLYFTRSLHPENKGGNSYGQDIWYSDYISGSWSSPTNDLKLNNALNNSVIGISTEGDRLFLQGTYIKKIDLQKGFSFAPRTEDDFAKPSVIDIPGLNIKTDFYGAFVVPTEDIMIISMQSKYSKGLEDLYVSFFQDDKWTKPLWLGDSVNSEGFEITPHLLPDNKTMLFASNGMGGAGDADIFYAYRKDDSWTNWSPARNAGTPLNSEAFDAAPFVAGEIIYFSSNRNDSLSNIYSAIINHRFYKIADTLRLSFEGIAGNRFSDVNVEVFKDGSSLGIYKANSEEVIEIPGLKEKNEYQIVPQHDEIDATLLNPMVLNHEGLYLEKLDYSSEGQASVTPQTEAENRARETIELQQQPAGMHGILEVDGVGVKNTILALVDDDGKVYHYAETDDKGGFKFPETDDSLNLHMKLITTLEYVKKNAEIYYTDANGVRLFKTTVKENGEFDYQKLEARQMAQLKLLEEEGEDAQLINEGVFKFENLPQQGVKLFLYDENNNVIEEVVTDESGKFKFSKLDPDMNYNIQLADPNSAYADGSLALYSSKGSEVGVMDKMSAGGFQYQAITPDIKKNLDRLSEVDQGLIITPHFVFTIGLFKYKSLPKDGITLRLLDENNNVAEIVRTDANGQFVFSMLEEAGNYKIEVEEFEGSDMLESQLYFVDKEGNVRTAKLGDDRLYTFDKLDGDYYFSMSQISEDEAKLLYEKSFRDVQGAFTFNDLPQEGVELYLLDENGKVIETTYTDADGNFVFSRLATESNYLVRLSEDVLKAGSQLIVLDENGEELVQEGEDGEFAFRTLPKSQARLAGVSSGDNLSLDFSKFLSNDKGSKALEDSKNDVKLSTIYFNFNSVRLSNNDRYKLNHRVVMKAKQTAQPILVVGYSCDLGSDEASVQVAELRATQIKKYLMNCGVSEEQIELHGIGAKGEGMTNTERIESRRVEIYHLAP